MASAKNLYEQIKQDILDNKLPINQSLKQEDMSTRYSISRIPIRDTMAQLKNDGWLVGHGKRGFMIAPLNAQEAEDLYQMRMLIEPLVLAYALPHLNQQILGRALDISMHMEHSQSLNAKQQGELNWQFHACIYDCCKRTTLLNTIAQLHQQCSRYIGYHNTSLAYIHTSENEHRLLIEALSNKRLIDAQQILKQHIQKAGELIVLHLLKK